MGDAIKCQVGLVPRDGWECGRLRLSSVAAGGPGWQGTYPLYLGSSSLKLCLFSIAYLVTFCRYCNPPYSTSGPHFGVLFRPFSPRFPPGFWGILFGESNVWVLGTLSNMPPLQIPGNLLVAWSPTYNFLQLPSTSASTPILHLEFFNFNSSPQQLFHRLRQTRAPCPSGARE